MGIARQHQYMVVRLARRRHTNILGLRRIVRPLAGQLRESSRLRLVLAAVEGDDVDLAPHPAPAMQPDEHRQHRFAPDAVVALGPACFGQRSHEGTLRHRPGL
ncbi:hypothetical protein P0F65_00265 [Sphingomonas sp. I4]